MSDTEKKTGLLATLGSTTLTLVLLAIFAVAIAVATFIEAGMGTPAARALVYNALWFEGLLALLVVNAIISLIVHMPYTVRQTGFVITHIGFIVVLVSAGITRHFGYEGRMTIREGTSTDYMYSQRDYVQLEAAGNTASFEMKSYKPGSKSAEHRMTVGGKTYQVAIDEYWSHVDGDIKEGPGGVPMARFSISGVGDNILLSQGESLDAEGITVHFVPPGEAAAARTAEWGELVIDLDGTEHRLAVPRDPPAEMTVGGYVCRITEFAPDYKVGTTPVPDAPMDNPAIRVEVTGPDGTKYQRFYFAYYPDFSMGHADGTFDTLPIHLVYEYTRNIYLSHDGESLRARADFPVSVSSHASAHANTDILVGENVTIGMGTILHAGTFLLRPVDVWKSGVESYRQGNNPDLPPGVRVTVTDESGASDQVVAIWGRGRAQAAVAGMPQVLYGPVRIPLPYRLQLDDFVLKTYPGSRNPASFESHVRLFDEARGIDGEPISIYMNHPLTYRGYKHFQSSYDRDLKGTILTVNHDPGKIPTYLGYTLIGIGFLITLTRGAWYRVNNGSTMKRVKPAAAAAVAGLILAAGPFHLAAQTQTGDDPHAGHAHAQSDEVSDPHAGHQAMREPARNYLSDAARRALSALMVQDYQGRMKPLDTLARESVMKVSKKSEYDGWEPVDMYLSWLAYPDYWYAQPVVAVRNADVKKVIGVDPATKRVTVASLYDGGDYRLEGEVDKAHRTPDRDRSKMQRKLLSFDDRVNVFNMGRQGLTLRAFPLPGDANNRWLSPAEFTDEILASMDPKVRDLYQDAFTKLYVGLQTMNNASILEGAQKLNGIQHTWGADVIPSESARKAEMTLNKLQPFTWVTIPYLLAFGVLMLAYAWGLWRRQGQRFPLRHPLYALGMLLFLGSVAYHAWAYVLRWQASGHAPLSNGYESLIFIGVAIAIVGAYYELRERRASIAALAAMLTAFILGVAMLPTFDPAIGPLVPVLASFWLIVHVTVITASYGFLGLAAVIALTMLMLTMFKAPGRNTLRFAIADLHRLHWNVLIAGVAFLSVGTFLGGVWANESWGRYWGWDPKETWSLITILVYAFVLHFRFVEKLNRPIYIAAGSFFGIASVGMTYFGVNYLLSGLHSYAQGDAPGTPPWVWITLSIMTFIIVTALVVDKTKSWKALAKA